MTVALWYLIPAVVLPPLVLNLYRWRRDVKFLQTLTADLRNRPPKLGPLPDPAPRVSFLIAAWNEAPTIAACLQAVLRLDYPDLEVVVCAGGLDHTWHIASAIHDPRLILLQQQPGEGKQRSLRRCLERASGEIIYLHDGDSLITDAVFARVLGPVVLHEEQVVCGSVYTPLPEQLGNPFVLSQCSCALYTALHGRRTAAA